MARTTFPRVLSVSLALLISSAASLPAQCPTFQRGDANADGDFDLSDAVATLLYLFSAGAEPPCADAADSDDSGKIELTDAVYSLNHLFLGGAEPPAPGPGECGRDGTFDALECQAYPPCEPVSTPRDFTAFTAFETRQNPAFGYCPDLERPYKVVIVKKDGGYAVTITTLRNGVFGVDDCLPQVRGSECHVPVEEPERLLTPEETGALLELFSAVEVFAERDTICFCIAIDPCRVDTFTWDGEEISAFPCSAPRVGDGQASKLLEFLSSLRGEQ